MLGRCFSKLLKKVKCDPFGVPFAIRLENVCHPLGQIAQRVFIMADGSQARNPAASHHAAAGGACAPKALAMARVRPEGWAGLVKVSQP